MVLLFVGVAVTVALSANNNQHALWGLVPAAVGVANLLVYFIEGRRAPRSDDSRQ